MKWIIVAIVIFIPLYTWLTLHYRRPGQAYEPYAEARDRATVTRLLAAGYRRVELEAARPTEPLPESAPARITPANGGLPAGLAGALAELPLLPADITHVLAPRAASPDKPYVIEFTCRLPDDKEQLLDAQFYERGNELVFAPNFERAPGSLLLRSPENTVRLTVPAGVLKPGHYRVLLAGARQSQSWGLTVR
ncbi:MAG: hypothetical protein KGJ37_04810 [Verrucomicrobiota bacterium]|nr:hypothetical protein [Verrucomicrobiota bacterium]